MQWLKYLLGQNDYREPNGENFRLQSFERFDEKLTPNLRALRLTMTIADYLLSMGVPVSDVVGTSLDITDVYCKRSVQVDVNSTVLMFSQDRGNDREPLTLIRHATPRVANNMLVQSIQELVDDIKKGGVNLAQAEERLHDIIADPKIYPILVTTTGSALISAGVGALLTGSLVIIVISFFVGLIVSYIVRAMALRQVPAFFSQVFAAAIITVAAGIVNWLSITTDIAILDGVNPSLIVIGGIIMLVAGLAIVGAVQDAIDEFYVTANARLLRVVMMTAGIVTGVLVGIYLMRQFGQPLSIDTERPILQVINWQYIGALLIAVGYAISVQSRWTSIVLAGGMGVLSWYVLVTSSVSLGVAIFAASGIAAAVVGAVSSFLSRVWRVPANELITAGIIPLVPGLTLFNGLLQVVQSSTESDTLTGGIITLLNAILIAVAVAAGATFGNMLARPIDRTLVRARNALPNEISRPMLTRDSKKLPKE